MEDIFITNIHVNKVRHLEDVNIVLSETERKHLILTGKNGSGKTSVLEEMMNNEMFESYHKTQLNISNKISRAFKPKLSISFYGEIWKKLNYPVFFFQAKRFVKFENPRGVAKIPISNNNDDKSKKKLNSHFIQQLVNIRYELLEAKVDEKIEIENKLQSWIDNFKNLLSKLYNDTGLKLEYDKESYNYEILLSDGRKFNFNQLSDGYSSIIDIVSEILMSAGNNIASSYALQGIVLIDEIETHLHIDLQKKILPFLTSFFPKIQFIVTTHSPFVLSSISNAVIFDLEKQERIEDLSGYSLDAIVKGYFNSNNYSETMMQELREYENFLKSNSLTVEQKMRKNQLRASFDSLPTFLAPEIQLKLNQLKLAELELTHD
ncbi:MAG: AAA family ATPase [Emticicia sp.]|nr:AAA family ATPase [Emticicia sp.]